MNKARHFEHRGPFLQVVSRGCVCCVDNATNKTGGLVLRVRQATNAGYIECDPNGVFDIAYPDSQLRRARVKERGKVAGTIMAGEPAQCVFIVY